MPTMGFGTLYLDIQTWNSEQVDAVANGMY